MEHNNRITALLDKCEAMSILCNRANEYWGFIKTCFQIPLILTGGVMCILNSFDDGKTTDMKIPNVIVNGLSVLLLSYQNQLKVVEKVETYKSLTNNFLLLAHQIEGLEPDEIDRNMVNNLTDKYDTFVMTCEFRDIPKRYKLEVRRIMKGKTLPLQLNGGSGLVDRSSRELNVSIGNLSEQV